MKIAELNSRQLVRQVLQGKSVSRIVTGPLAVHYCARLAGRTLREYTSDARILAECVARYYETFQPDAVWLSADTWVTAEAMGAAVRFPGEDQPLCGTGEPFVQRAADVGRIAASDFLSRGRYPLMLDAVRRLRRAVGGDVFIVACFDQYPFSLACELLGAEKAILIAYEDRPLVEAIMERGLEFAAAYGHALADAGADMLSGGDSPAGLLGPKLYSEVALPFETRLVSMLKAATELPVSLHICGNATPVLSAMVSTGADVLELDYRVPMAEAIRCVGDGITIWGNLDPVSVLAQGTVEQVRQASIDLIHTIKQHSHRRFVLSSGCALAMETPFDNLRAMLDVAKSERQ